MATLRETVVIGNVFNFPIMNPNNDRVLGVFAIAFPLVVFLDTLFEKKGKVEDGGGKGTRKHPSRPRPGGIPLLAYKPPPNLNVHGPPYLQTTPYVNPYQLAYQAHPRYPAPPRHTVSPGYANLMQNSHEFSNSDYKSQPLKQSGFDSLKTHFQDKTHGRRPLGKGVPKSHYQLHHQRRDGSVSPSPHGRRSQSRVKTAGPPGYSQATRTGPSHRSPVYSGSHARHARPSHRSPVYSGSQGRDDRTKRNRRNVDPLASNYNTKKFADEYPNHSYLPHQRKIELGGSRSISEDQASVYTQFANMMSTAGVDGSSCLQYIICELAQREATRAEDLNDNSGTIDTHRRTSPYPNKASQQGGSKKKKSKSSLMADIVATLLLPKQSQPLGQYVEAADSTIGASCGARYPGCPLGLSTVLETILGHR